MLQVHSHIIMGWNILCLFIALPCIWLNITVFKYSFPPFKLICNNMVACFLMFTPIINIIAIVCDINHSPAIFPYRNAIDITPLIRHIFISLTTPQGHLCYLFLSELTTDLFYLLFFNLCRSI